MGEELKFTCPCLNCRHRREVNELNKRHAMQKAIVAANRIVNPALEKEKCYIGVGGE